PASPIGRRRRGAGARGGCNRRQIAVAGLARPSLGPGAAARAGQRLLPRLQAAGALLRYTGHAARAGFRPTPQTASAARAGRRGTGASGPRLAAAATAALTARIRGGVAAGRRRLSRGPAPWLPPAAVGRGARSGAAADRWPARPWQASVTLGRSSAGVGCRRLHSDHSTEAGDGFRNTKSELVKRRSSRSSRRPAGST